MELFGTRKPPATANKTCMIPKGKDGCLALSKISLHTLKTTINCRYAADSLSLKTTVPAPAQQSTTHTTQKLLAS